MGSLTILTSNYSQLQQVAQVVNCWALTDVLRIETVSVAGNTAIRIPEAVFAGKGALALRRDGTDLLAGYVAGTDIVASVNNASVAVSQTPTTCPARTNQPTIISMTTNVGGNPLAVTLNYANFTGAGLVDIQWGDGTSTLGAAESNAALAHTYPVGGIGFPRTVTVTDATDATQFATAVFVV
jgi:hypothetical protein